MNDPDQYVIKFNGIDKTNRVQDIWGGRKATWRSVRASVCHLEVGLEPHTSERVSYVKGEYFVYFKIPNMSISSQTIPLSSSLITRQSTGPHRRHHSHYLRANNSILNCRVPLSHCGGYWGFWEPALSTWQEGDGWYARDNVIQHTNNVEIAVQCSNDGSHSWSNILADKRPSGSVLLSDHLEIKWWQIKHCLNKDVPSDVIWTNQQSHWSLK